MPDGVLSTATGDPADERALAADARLIRGVRLRLVLWSGLTTLVVLAVLGFALYSVTARSLQTTGEKQLDDRAQAFRQHPDPGGGPGQGFIFGGNSSGTFALLFDDAGEPVGRGSLFVPAGLPVSAGIDAARQTGLDIRTVYIQVFQDRTSELQTLDAIRTVLLVGGLLVVLVAFGFGAFYASRAL